MFRLRGDKAKNFPREYLYGGETVPEEVALRGMADFEKKLTKQFHDERKSRDENARIMKKIYSPLKDLVNSDKNAASGIREMREMLDRRRAQKRMPPKIAKTKEERRIGLSDCNTFDNVVPPYDFEWTWSDTYGTGEVRYLIANKSKGFLDCDLDTDNNYNSVRSASAVAAVGIFFRPPIQEGTLRFWAMPYIEYNWYTGSFFEDAYSYGSIGLFANRFNVSDNSPAGTVVDTRETIWYDHDFLGIDGPEYPIGDNYFIDSPLFNVDRDHWYALFVLSGSYVDVQGGICTAHSFLSTGVDSINWDLSCVQL